MSARRLQLADVQRIDSFGIEPRPLTLFAWCTLWSGELAFWQLDLRAAPGSMQMFNVVEDCA